MGLARESLSGIWVPLVTPFRDDAPDLERLEPLVHWLLARGVRGFLALGTTGEAPHLGEDEAALVLRAVVASVAGRVPVLAGCGRPSARGTLRAIEAAAQSGAAGALVLTPFYYRRQLGPEALVGFYHEIAASAPLPLFVYHLPQVTELDLDADLLGRLLQHPNIWGFKDSAVEGGPLAATLQRAATLGFTGHGGGLLAALDAGACGGILAVAHVLPEAAVAVYEAQRRGQRAEAERAQAVLIALVSAWRGRGIAGVKCGLRQRGLDCGEPRRPLEPLPATMQAAVAAAVDAAGRAGYVR